jgi:uncharacterized membrane protein
MNALPTDDLVRDYLARVEAYARFLPADRRRDLLSNLAEHIATARAESATDDEAAVRTILDRLGEPDQILESESPGHPEPAGPPAHPARTGWTGQWALDGFTIVGTVLGLLVAGLVPVLGWAVAAVLVWMSRSWTARAKVAGTAVTLGFGGGLCALLYWSIGSSYTASCDGAGCTPPPEPAFPRFLHVVGAPVGGLLLLVVATVAVCYLIRYLLASQQTRTA